MKKRLKYLLSALMLCGSTYAVADREKIIRVYRNGEIIHSYKASEIDYIQVEDYVEAPEPALTEVADSVITISWAPIEGATYSIYRSADNNDFELLAEGIEETSFTDNNPLPLSNFYRVKATVGDSFSDLSESIEVHIIPQFDIRLCSREPIDLSISVWNDSIRYFLTQEELAQANQDSLSIEGLTITGQSGSFIISPQLLNQTNVDSENALIYYLPVLPDSKQAMTISARINDINSALEASKMAPFITDRDSYFYMTKTPADGKNNVCMELANFAGGALTQNGYGHIRGVMDIPDNQPIKWHDDSDMTLALNENGDAEGLRISIGGQDFIIKLNDERQDAVVKDSAMSHYADILPTKLQADVIAMRYADINYRLRESGGSPFAEGDYLSKMSFDDQSNFAINFSNEHGASVTTASEGFIRGVITLNNQVDSVLTIRGAYDIVHSLNAENDDALGKIRLAEIQDPLNSDEIIYLERDGIFLSRSEDGKWYSRWNQSSLFGEYNGFGIVPYPGHKYIFEQTGIEYTANDSGRLIPENSTEETVRVTHWNIGGFAKGNTGSFTTSDSLQYQAILSEFTQVIDSVKPQLIGCSEYLPQIYEGNLIRDDLFSAYPYELTSTITGNYSGKAFFSNWPLINPQTLQIGNSIALEAEIIIGNQLFKICICHPTWWKSEIDNNWIELSELARRYKYVDRVILMGDFNVLRERETESWELFTNSGFSLGNHGEFGAIPTTYNSVICSMDLDNIMVKGAEILEVSTIQFTPEGLDPANPDAADELLWDAVNPSDHFPFTAVIRTLNR